MPLLATLFQNRINVMVAARANRADVGRAVAKTAADRVAALIGTGNASPVYRRFVDGVEGADPASVRLDGGTILYVFSNLAQAVIYGLEYARLNSPQVTGRYKNDWFAVVDNKPWVAPLASIPPGSFVMLVNFAPYARRLEEGGRTGRSGRLKSYPHPKYVVSEMTRRAVAAKFPNLVVRRTFALIPGGYILKTGPRAGDAMTYPAVTISESP